MPPSGLKNSYRCLPDVGKVIVSELPSPPVTLPATKTEVGIVMVCVIAVTVISKIILPNCVATGKLVRSKVIDPLVVSV